MIEISELDLERISEISEPNQYEEPLDMYEALKEINKIIQKYKNGNGRS